MVNSDLSLSFGYEPTELNAIFEQYRKAGYWKSSWTNSNVNAEDKDKLVAAIRFYLADDPKVTDNGNGTFTVQTKGYMADGDGEGASFCYVISMDDIKKVAKNPE